MQQSASTVQICPNCAQPMLPSTAGGGGDPASSAGGLPASPGGGLPASAGGGLPPQGPQIPWVLPWPTRHVVPGQQSAVVVHAPQAAMHCWAAQTNGGLDPAELGTQGRPPQQFALDAQA